MANPQHLAWLREGVEAWNARRQRDDFRPNLREANLGGAYLGGANLGGANLGGAYLRGANLRRAHLGGAVLRGANLRRAYLGGTDLEGANLGSADLGGADLGGAYLGSADLGGADVRSFDIKDNRIVYSGAGTNDGGAPEYTTDLSTALNLMQGQLNSLRGDRWTKIPDHLKRPKHWLEEGKSDAAAEQEEQPQSVHNIFWEPSKHPRTVDSGSTVSRATRSHIVRNREVILLGSASALAQIEEYRERLKRSGNQLDAETLSDLMGFLDRIETSVKGVRETVPTPREEPTDEDIEAAKGWFDELTDSVREDYAERFSPKKLGKLVIPGGLVLTLGGLGWAFGGPIGGAVTGAFGRFLLGELNAGGLSDAIGKAAKPTEPPKPNAETPESPEP